MYSREIFIEHSILMDPFKSKMDEKEKVQDKQKTRKNFGNKKLKDSIQNKNFYRSPNINNMKEVKNHNVNIEKNIKKGRHTNDNHFGDQISSALEHKRYDKDDNNVENVININNHNNILCKNKQIIKFAENEESNALNIHNLILNNLFVPQKNVYHIKKNNSFLLYKGKRKKSNFLYSMRNSYYTFLKKYMEYNNYMHKVKNTSLLSIGFCFQLKNIFLFHDKEDSLFYLHSKYIKLEHLFNPCFINNKHNNSVVACNRFEFRESSNDKTSHSNNSKKIYKEEKKKYSDYIDGKNMYPMNIDQTVKNKELLLYIKSLKLKKNNNVYSLRIDIVNCNLNEVCISLLSVYKYMIPYDHLELIKIRLKKYYRIKQFLIDNNKNTSHLRKFNITNKLLYMILDNFFYKNHMIGEKNQMMIHNKKYDDNMNIVKANKNYERYIKNLVIKILDHEKILYNKEDFEEIFYMIVRRNAYNQQRFDSLYFKENDILKKK